MAGVLTLEDVEATLARFDSAGAGTYALYVEDGKIGIERWLSGRNKKNVIARLNSIDINEGLTPQTWNRIEAGLRRLNEKVVT